MKLNQIIFWCNGTVDSREAQVCLNYVLVPVEKLPREDSSEAFEDFLWMNGFACAVGEAKGESAYSVLCHECAARIMPEVFEKAKEHFTAKPCT
jgi:hypothetical protein